MVFGGVGAAHAVESVAEGIAGAGLFRGSVGEGLQAVGPEPVGEVVVIGVARSRFPCSDQLAAREDVDGVLPRACSVQFGNLLSAEPEQVMSSLAEQL